MITINLIVSLLTLFGIIVLLIKGAKMARSVEQLETDINEIDAATNQVADLVVSLRDQIKNGMTPEEVTRIKLRLDAADTRLRAIGSDPEEPVPPIDPNQPIA